MAASRCARRSLISCPVTVFACCFSVSSIKRFFAVWIWLLCMSAALMLAFVSAICAVSACFSVLIVFSASLMAAIFFVCKSVSSDCKSAIFTLMAVIDCVILVLIDSILFSSCFARSRSFVAFCRSSSVRTVSGSTVMLEMPVDTNKPMPHDGHVALLLVFCGIIGMTGSARILFCSSAKDCCILSISACFDAILLSISMMASVVMSVFCSASSSPCSASRSLPITLVSIICCSALSRIRRISSPSIALRAIPSSSACSALANFSARLFSSALLSPSFHPAGTHVSAFFSPYNSPVVADHAPFDSDQLSDTSLCAPSQPRA